MPFCFTLVFIRIKSQCSNISGIWMHTMHLDTRLKLYFKLEWLWTTGPNRVFLLLLQRPSCIPQLPCNPIKSVRVEQRVCSLQNRPMSLDKSATLSLITSSVYAASTAITLMQFQFKCWAKSIKPGFKFKCKRNCMQKQALHSSYRTVDFLEQMC